MPILDSHTIEFFSRSPEQTRRAGLRLGAATGRVTFSPNPPPGLESQRVILNW